MPSSAVATKNNPTRPMSSGAVGVLRWHTGNLPFSLVLFPHPATDTPLIRNHSKCERSPIVEITNSSSGDNQTLRETPTEHRPNQTSWDPRWACSVARVELFDVTRSHRRGKRNTRRCTKEKTTRKNKTPPSRRERQSRPHYGCDVRAVCVVALSELFAIHVVVKFESSSVPTAIVVWNWGWYNVFKSVISRVCPSLTGLTQVKVQPSRLGAQQSIARELCCVPTEFSERYRDRDVLVVIACE